MKLKSKVLSILLSCTLIIGMLPTIAFAQDTVQDTVWTDYAAAEFAGGTGTEEDPYQIATAEQLAKLSKDVSGGSNYQGKFFQLTENIDLSSHRWVPIGLYKWELDGSTTNKSFQGFLDGNHKTISGLVVDESTDKNAAGLFGNIRNVSGGTVGAKDLTISSANIYAAEDGLNQLYAGILAGYVLANPGEQAVFENISVSGSVVVESTDGYNSVGGMIGCGDRIKATNCKAENISVEGASNSGGFIGLAGGSAFENCKVSGTVSGTWALGGFVGYIYSAMVDGTEPSVYEKCAADVKIEGSDWRLGGFAGYAESGEFDNCVALGDVASTVDGWEPKVGGFIGESDDSVAATACHATGTVTSESLDYEAGGFVGCYTGGTFEGCSFDNEKNSGLAAAGDGTISAGVAGGNSNDVLTNICEDYYGGHQYSSEWTIDTEPTCTTKGSKSKHCIHCDLRSEITEIPEKEHKYINGECIWCHVKDPNYNPPTPPIVIVYYDITAVQPEHGKITLSTERIHRYGDVGVTLTAEEGYEVRDLLINGKSVGAVSNYTIEDVTEDIYVTAVFTETEEAKNDRIAKGVENTTIKMYYKKGEIGKGWIKLRFKKSYGFKVDNYEIFRSAKKKTNFGEKPWFVTKTNKISGYYKNGKFVKKGTRYYYKMRGVREIDGKTYYTQWSNVVMRTGR